MHSRIEAGTGLTDQSALTAPSDVRPHLHPETSIGTVRLRVSDPSRSVRFYEQVLGLQPVALAEANVGLTAGSDRVLVELHGERSAPRVDPRKPGLYHLAILMPDRPQLAAALARVGSARWPLSGASDHLVSEALYLSDPDGNGIEIYRDRPREEWPERDGELAMATLPLDLHDLLAELGEQPEIEAQAPAGTSMGHVHLQVSDLAQAEAFYSGVLGFDVTVRSYPGALFVSAGGYHHHIGLNTWRSAGASPPQIGSIGLGSFEVLLPTPDELNTVVGRVTGAGLELSEADGGLLVRDPSGNGVLLRAAAG